MLRMYGPTALVGMYAHEALQVTVFTVNYSAQNFNTFLHDLFV